MIINKLIRLVKYRGIQFPDMLHDPSELDLPEGWSSLHYDDIPKITRELHREMCKEHVLYSAPACALGRRSHTDDFLFQVDLGEHKFAWIHLTWHREKDPTWPMTKLYASFQEWFDDESSKSCSAR